MSRPDDPRSRRAWRLSALLYALLIAYGSLFPFSGWTRPPEPWAWLRWPPDVAHWSRADLLVNILAYVPLGFGLASGSSPRRSGMAAVLWAALAGFALSFSIESTQAYLPARVSSLGDLLTNTGGTLLGAMLARGLGSRGHAGRLLADWRASAPAMLVWGWGLLAAGLAATALGWPSPVAGLHLLTLGAAGGMIFAISARAGMRRVPGRGLVARRRQSLGFVLLLAAAGLRLAAEFFPGALMLSGLCWSAAWLCHLAAHLPALFRPAPRPMLSAPFFLEEAGATPGP